LAENDSKQLLKPLEKPYHTRPARVVEYFLGKEDATIVLPSFEIIIHILFCWDIT
jgi:hypothetical protein